MSWSITVNDLLANAEEVWRQDIIEQFISQNPEYAVDLGAALGAARQIGLASATLSGGRTPTPGSDDEVVVISITGMVTAKDFNSAMQRILNTGADAEALAHRAEARDVSDRIP